MTILALLALVPGTLLLDTTAGSATAGPKPFTCPPVQRAADGSVGPGGDLTGPEKIKEVEAVYPASAREARKEGRVAIAARITTDGKVRHPKVIKSLGADLDNAALEAVKQWEYTPAMFRGRPCELPLAITVNFSLTLDAKEKDGTDAPAPKE
jgi:periplasmic protein TonB